MRIAISGTHCMGKTTLIQDFLKIHPEYTHEVEPYYQLQEKHGIEFFQDPTLEDFLEQLDYIIERLHLHAGQANVIFDRCPIDFMAYSMHLLHQEEMNFYDIAKSL
jgi:uridine kinase